MTVARLETRDQKIARACRLLSDLGYYLHRHGGHFSVLDCIGGVWGAPHEATIDQVISFASADPAAREAMAAVERAKQPGIAMFNLRPYYALPAEGRR